MSPVGKGEIAATRAPSDAERAQLSARLTVIDTALAPSDIRDVRRVVAKLFGLLALNGADAENVKSLVDDYSAILAEHPLWAIQSACRAVVNSGSDFRPGAPRLLALARACAADLRAEAYQITLVLSARVYDVPSASVRASRAAALRDFAKKMEASAA